VVAGSTAGIPAARWSDELLEILSLALEQNS
jgi:hypothetical protein